MHCFLKFYCIWQINLKTYRLGYYVIKLKKGEKFKRGEDIK